MRVPISWLEDFTDVEDPAALAERLTAVGLESELHAPPKAPEALTQRLLGPARAP
jgi:hypothetical protein